MGGELPGEPVPVVSEPEHLRPLAHQREVGRHQRGQVPHRGRGFAAEEVRPRPAHPRRVEVAEGGVEQEPARHRRIEPFLQVRGAGVGEVVGLELAQDLVHHAGLPAGRGPAAVSQKRVRLVQQQEGAAGARLREGGGDPPFGPAHPLALQLGDAPFENFQTHPVGDLAGVLRLSRPGRAVEQQPDAAGAERCHPGGKGGEVAVGVHQPEVVVVQPPASRGAPSAPQPALFLQQAPGGFDAGSSGGGAPAQRQHPPRSQRGIARQFPGEVLPGAAFAGIHKPLEQGAAPVRRQVLELQRAGQPVEQVGKVPTEAADRVRREEDRHRSLLEQAVQPLLRRALRTQHEVLQFVEQDDRLRLVGQDLDGVFQALPPAHRQPRFGPELAGPDVVERRSDGARESAAELGLAAAGGAVGEEGDPGSGHRVPAAAGLEKPREEAAEFLGQLPLVREGGPGKPRPDRRPQPGAGEVGGDRPFQPLGEAEQVFGGTAHQPGGADGSLDDARRALQFVGEPGGQRLAVEVLQAAGVEHPPDHLPAAGGAVGGEAEDEIEAAEDRLVEGLVEARPGKAVSGEEDGDRALFQQAVVAPPAAGRRIQHILHLVAEDGGARFGAQQRQRHAQAVSVVGAGSRACGWSPPRSRLRAGAARRGRRGGAPQAFASVLANSVFPVPAWPWKSIRSPSREAIAAFSSRTASVAAVVEMGEVVERQVGVLDPGNEAPAKFVLRGHRRDIDALETSPPT